MRLLLNSYTPTSSTHYINLTSATGDLQWDMGHGHSAFSRAQLTVAATMRSENPIFGPPARDESRAEEIDATTSLQICEREADSGT